MKNLNTPPVPGQAKQKKPFYKRIWFIVLVVLIVVGVFGTSGSSEKKNTDNKSEISEKTEEKKAVEYKEVDAATMIAELEDNALNASDTYKDQYVSVSGKLDNIDSDGSYINIAPLDDSFTLTFIQCYVKSDEQLETIKSKSKGDPITVKGKVTDVGEVLGYSIDIDSVE